MSNQKNSPRIKAIAFFDAQNLYYAAKNTFGYTFPNYDPKLLAKAVCKQKGWILEETRIYTGVPKKKDKPFWHHFWTAKLTKINMQKRTFVFSRTVHYNKKIIKCTNGRECEALVGNEKGVDARITIDTIRLALKKKYDVALIFSQDQDLSEAVEEIKEIGKEQGRWIKVASAFPKNPNIKHFKQGIEKTEWVPFEKKLYDTCIDKRDYRPKE